MCRYVNPLSCHNLRDDPQTVCVVSYQTRTVVALPCSLRQTVKVFCENVKNRYYGNVGRGKLDKHQLNWPNYNLAQNLGLASLDL